MGVAGDDRVTDQRTHREPVPARRFGGGDGEVIPFRRRESLAARLEREWEEREQAEQERRAQIERQRAERDRLISERLERRQRARLENLRRAREEERRQDRYVWSRRRRANLSPPQRGQSAKRHPRVEPPRPSADSRRARIDPAVQGPVRKRARTAENRRRAAARSRGLFWPTAKAGFAVTLVLGLSAGLGSVLGLPVPGLDAGTGRQSLASSAAAFGTDAGTPPGLAAGYVFPVLGPHGFGEAAARFGAERYGHTHEGQDVFAKPGTPLVAVRDGIVIDGAGGKSFYAYGGGNSFVMYSPELDRSFVYLHMLHPARVRAGDHVHAGQVIGQVGCTGSCDGPHLHFEIRIGRVAYGHETKPLDPLPFLRQWPQSTPG